jgi:hypothetical protein
MKKQTFLSVLAAIVLAAGTGHAQKPNMHAEIHNPAKFDSGEDDLSSNPGHEVAEEHRPLLNLPRQSQSNNRPDGALQGGSGPAVNTTDGVGFDGVPANGYAPPDTNMAVGPNHVIQWVNVRFAIYDKLGNILPGYPKPGNAFWTGFGGPCETQNSGDPIIQYDAVADRWIATQFTSSLSNGAYYQCFAISQTSDPNGAYNRYAYAFTDGFPDYPKISVWKNAYFASYNMFSSTSGGWLGPRICAYDRAAMLAGTSAVQECFLDRSGFYGSLLPADLDGGSAFAPPSTTGYFLDYGSNSLALWRFTPDFVTNNPSLVGPISIPAASFSPACGGACVPQQGTSQKLDTLSDRLMYRLAYRNFGGYEAMVVNQSVTAGTSIGIRWYEIRNPLTSPTIYQQGTYAPDTTYRWMGSAAMDKTGNFAVGYSASSSTALPSIRYTGRETTDPLNTLQAEQVIFTSGGSQGAGLSRWGDYAAMRIDPSDDCTFWFTTEYIPSNGTFNWHTRIASFKFNSCGVAPTPDFTLAATPASRTVVQGSGTTYDVTIGRLGSFSGDVALSASGLPAGASASFSPNPATGAASTMNVSTNASTTPPGTYTLTITGTGSGVPTHNTTVTLVVQAPPPAGDFSLSATPPSQTIGPRQSAPYAVTINKLNGFNSAVTFSVSGLPPRTSASFSPTSSTTGTTLTVKANPSAKPTNPTTLTITGISGSLTHTTTVTLTIQ